MLDIIPSATPRFADPTASDLFPRALARANLPTAHGTFRIVAFENLHDGKGHIALVKGDLERARAVPTRVHSECLTGDALSSMRCDCRAQLEKALAFLGQQPAGLLLYMRQEGRGIGLCNKIRAYELQDQGLDTVEANLALGFRDDERDYVAAAEMLRCLEVASIQLMTNNPNKIEQLRGYGIDVEGRVPHQIAPTEFNRAYLATKKAKSRHLLTDLEEA
ncbi:MAG: GTP cyclohydrolase II [Myxococcota bacterium]